MRGRKGPRQEERVEKEARRKPWYWVSQIQFERSGAILQWSQLSGCDNGLLCPGLKIAPHSFKGAVSAQLRRKSACSRKWVSVSVTEQKRTKRKKGHIVGRSQMSVCGLGGSSAGKSAGCFPGRPRFGLGHPQGRASTRYMRPLLATVGTARTWHKDMPTDKTPIHIK